jgi:hypothetical protein
MRCFNNGRANLTAGDRIADLKARTIYAATGSELKHKGGKCGNYNGSVKIYKRTGALRSADSHELLLSLSRGHALCLDGSTSHDSSGNQQRGLEKCPGPPVGRGLNSAAACGGETNTQVKLSMPWNMYTTMNLADPGKLCLQGYVVLTSRNTDGDIRLNSVDASGNLDGSGVIIDPSNILFGTNEMCPFPLPLQRWKRFASMRRGIKIVGTISDTYSYPQPSHSDCAVVQTTLAALLQGGGTNPSVVVVGGDLSAHISPQPPSFTGSYITTVISAALSASSKDIPTGFATVRQAPCCSSADDLITIYARPYQGWFATIEDVAAGHYPPAPPFAKFAFTVLWQSDAGSANTMPQTYGAAVIEPVEVIRIHGDPCVNNLSWGNWTKQNYMASFNFPDPHLGFGHQPFKRELGR